MTRIVGERMSANIQRNIVVMNAGAQRTALIAALKQKFDDVQTECRNLPWLTVPDMERLNGPLKRVFNALVRHRGYTEFATPGHKLACDIVIPARKLIIEYDERQHFTAPRAIALKCYPEGTVVGFERSEWIEYCEAIDAHDNAPVFRDEQRAFYDSARDLLASANGYRVVRIKDGAIDWTSGDTNTELSKLCGSSAAKGVQIGARVSAARAVPQADQGARLVTVCIQGRPAQRDHTNTRRLAWLPSLIEEIDKKWRGLDAGVFPGGFLRIRTCIGDLDYAGRAKALRGAGFVDPIKDAAGALKHSSGALIIFGVDGPNYPDGSVRDQLCVAVDKSGVVGIARKIFPVKGDEADGLLCYDPDFSESKRVVTLASGRRAILLACYDMFGVAERGDINGKRAGSIRWIGAGDNEMERGDRQGGFRERLAQNLAAFRGLLNGVTVGITAIHGFEGSSTGFWQRHGIASCSAALNRGVAVGAAHFADLPRTAGVSTLAAAGVPRRHLQVNGHERQAHSCAPRDSFMHHGGIDALVRLYGG